ncbi:MAG: HAD-IIB family hydrolase [Lawsonibacter sp.]|nr:HAD-IIB family hydrolase [Lawsonibacter sp.]
MGKFDGLLLVSDFDDTLYDSRHQIPTRNLQAIQSFLAEGGRFTVATGRAHQTFAPHVHLVPINAPVVLSNGSALYDFETNQMLEQTFLSPTAVEDFERLLETFPSLGLEIYHEDDIFVWNPNPITEAHMKKVGTDYAIRPVAHMPIPWTKAILQQEHSTLLQVQAWLLEQYGHLYEAIFSNQYYLEITERGSTKGDMVAKMAKRLGIRPEHVYCVGDNQNDIPMLEQSAIPFAPANCAQEVKDWGARVLCHCDDGVIGDIVEILLKLY